MRDPIIHYMDDDAGEIVISRNVKGNVYSLYERRKSKALAEKKPFMSIMNELFYDLAEEARNGGC